MQNNSRIKLMNLGVLTIRILNIDIKRERYQKIQTLVNILILYYYMVT